MNGCPGADLRNLTAVEVTCASCGASVELFSDEQRRRCPSCGERVSRDAVPACAAWCPSAEQCVGTERMEGLLETIRDRVDSTPE